MAKNRAGEAECTVQLTVLPKELPAPPKFTVRAENRTIKEGEAVLFRCCVVGYPQPSIAWQKDGKPIQLDSPRHHVKIESGEEITAVLSIDAANKTDNGWYQCLAANVRGTASCRTKLSVQPGADSSEAADKKPKTARTV